MMLRQVCDRLALPQLETSYSQPVVLLHVIDALCIRMDQLEGKTIMLEDESEKR